MNFEGFDSADFEMELEDVEVKKTGKHERMFKFGFGGSIAGKPLIYEDLIIFTAMDGYVYCIDKITSETVWRFGTGGPMHFCPLAGKGSVIVGSFDGYLYCISLEGKELWRFKTGGKIAGSGSTDGKNVYVGSRDGCLYAIDLVTGKEKWRFKTGDIVVSSVTMSGDRIIFGSFDGNLYCINREGKELWRFGTGDEVNCRFRYPVSGNHLYFPSFDNHLYCIDIRNGKEVWRFRTGKYGSTGSPTLHKGVIYHGTRDGFFLAIDAETGKEIWRVSVSDPDNPISSKPFVTGNRIYFGTDDSYVYCMNLGGKIEWRFRTGNQIGCPPVYENGIIYIGSFDCKMYAIDAETGEEIWRYATSTSTPSFSPPAREAFSVEVRKESETEEPVEGKYSGKAETGSLESGYTIKSEYTTTSDYKAKSDYDVSFVIFEDNGLTEALPPSFQEEGGMKWTSKMSPWTFQRR